MGFEHLVFRASGRHRIDEAVLKSLSYSSFHSMWLHVIVDQSIVFLAIEWPLSECDLHQNRSDVVPA